MNFPSQVFFKVEEGSTLEVQKGSGILNADPKVCIDENELRLRYFIFVAAYL